MVSVFPRVLRRAFLPIVLLAALGACSLPEDKDQPPANMGNFRLGHNIVVVKDPIQGPLSRKADEGSWKVVLKDEIGKRFGGYEGDKLYHLGVSVEAYVLALPGVPLVVSPKSILIINATVWDDAAGKKLNEEPKQITVLENLSGKTVVGSGLTQNKKQQQRNLSVNAARAIQKWLLENPQWFDINAEEAAAAAAAIQDGSVDTKALLDKQNAQEATN